MVILLYKLGKDLYTVHQFCSQEPSLFMRDKIHSLQDYNARKLNAKLFTESA